MKSLRRLIRRIILESAGIDVYDVMELSAEENDKRYLGAYAKDIFRREADRDFLDSLGYIHSIPFASLDSRLSKLKQKDELSCLITHSAYEGEDLWEVSLKTGKFMDENSVGLIIDGWVTWAANRNANTGHTGSLKKRYGEKPHSGMSKAPGKSYHMRYSNKERPGGGRVPQHELDRAMLDVDDLDNDGLHYGEFVFNDETGKREYIEASNNEAILDNWTVIGVCHVVKWTDGEDKLTEEYDAKVMEAYEKVKKRFPKAKLVKVYLD